MLGFRVGKSVGSLNSGAGITIVAIFLLSIVFPVQSYALGFSLGAAAGYAVLYEGGGTGNFQLTSDSGVTGNVGIGAPTGSTTVDVKLASGTITGNLDFAKAVANNCTAKSAPAGSDCGGTVTGAVEPNILAVTTALDQLNSLSSSLGAEAGANLNVTGSTTINITSGVLDASGNYVFNLTGWTAGDHDTITIVGDTAGHSVVFNYGSTTGIHINGTIVESGNLTSDMVLFNLDAGANLLAGADLGTSSNKDVQSAIFLNPNGKINVNSVTIDGRLFGGDSADMSIVSNAYVNQPPTTSTVPEPTSIVLFGTVLLGVGRLLSKKLSFTK